MAAAKAKASGGVELLSLTPGECYVCSCTEDNACIEGCTWVDDQRSLCSTCERTGVAFLEWIIVAGRKAGR